MKKTLLSGLFLMVSLMVLGCGGEKAAAPAADASKAAPAPDAAPATPKVEAKK